MQGVLILALLAIGVLVLVGLLAIPIAFRKVVETNKVHIVQSGNKTTSYGSGQRAGNVYYLWPSWLPVFGVTRIVLPVNNFELPLKDYKAYDKDRVPFLLDIAAFFRIADTNVAAARIANFEELQAQLREVLKGAVRKILASHDIHEIMTGRATFGQQFTDEVRNELVNWGVEPVKNMELMDIRDTDDSQVIHNIMAKKSSHIAMESRVEIAKNTQIAETAETEARRAVEVARQDAAEQVGKRTAEKDMAVGIAQQQSTQAIKLEEAQTTEKEMAVQRVRKVKEAEIARDAAVVTAEQSKKVAILAAEGSLESTKLTADGIAATGEAKAKAEAAILMAPVDAKVRLAKEIGENPGYQTYLISLEQVQAQIQVGIAQAKALEGADVKVIANTGSAATGLTSVGELFTPKGGLAVASAIEAFKNTPEGGAILAKLTGKQPEAAPTPSKGAENGAART